MYEEKISIYGVEQPKLSILVELDDREPEDGLLLDIMLIPGMEEELDGCSMLQFFIEFSNDLELISDENLLELIETIAGYNFSLPLGTFGVHPDNLFLFFKHMMVLPKEIGTESEATIAQTLWLICYLQNQCYPQLQKILEGSEI